MTVRPGTVAIAAAARAAEQRIERRHCRGGRGNALVVLGASPGLEIGERPLDDAPGEPERHTAPRRHLFKLGRERRQRRREGDDEPDPRPALKRLVERCLIGRQHRDGKRRLDRRDCRAEGRAGEKDRRRLPAVGAGGGIAAERQEAFGQLRPERTRRREVEGQRIIDEIMHLGLGPAAGKGGERRRDTVAQGVDEGNARRRGHGLYRRPWLSPRPRAPSRRRGGASSPRHRR